MASTDIATDGRNAIIIITILAAVSSLCTFARIWIRRKGLLGVDDYLLVFAVAMLWTNSGGGYVLAIKGGEGKPFNELSPEEIEWLFKMFYWPALGYTILIVTVKTSILFSYNRIFGHNRMTRIHIYILLGLSWAWGIATFFVTIFQCTPIEKAWKPMIPGTCIDLLSYLWGNSVPNFIIDWLILAIPILPVWRLQMRGVQKSLVAGSLALGSIACIASTYRGAATGTLDINDLSKSVFAASIGTFIEPNAAIISACLPFFGSLVRDKLPKSFRSKPMLSKSFSRLRSTPSSQSHSGALSDVGQVKQSGISKHSVTTIRSTQRREGTEHELDTYTVVATAGRSSPSVSVENLV
ncbi:hypothetical protein B0I35DRAFT_444256 [Stachybotrys elegans]|uniref:Rhodopsin domain-containing protein n=1 Tax=Stachybotrys elegans TaxID=80388 RepID=A0A8K0WK46_9HYPO|nr:hypothetical protein B0I35DRAFT_444256 [Stachybotrys elegans]